MKESWKELPFAEAVMLNPRVPLEKGLDYPFVDMRSLNQGVRYVEPAEKKKFAGGAKFCNFDTLFARITPCLENGKIAQVRGIEGNFGFGSTEFIVIRGRHGVSDTNFAYYLSMSPEVRDSAVKCMTGTSGRQRVDVAAFGRTMTSLPPLRIQHRITDILGSLDDKIACNRRINDLLLNMARALFQHWFVDFGPFQKRGLQDSDIGPIPKGWAALPILDCCVLLSGGTPKSSVEAYWNGDILWASAKDISQCGAVYLLDTERRITQLGVENSATKVLPEGTVVVVARGSVGKYAILGRDMAMNQTCYGLRGKDGFSQEWVYLMLADVVPKLQQAAHGTIFDTITTTTFQTTKIVVPPRPVLENFVDKVKPLFEQILANLKENQILAQTRDYLLPKLLSGEVEVKAAEKEMEAVA